jgi:hypothetical protein
MSLRRLRPRDRRALLLGLAVLLPAAAYRVGVAPFLQYRSGLVEALAAERDLYARERSALSAASSNPDPEGSIRAVLQEAEPWILGGSSSLAATGTLSRLVTDAGRTSGILIHDVHTQNPADDAGPMKSAAISVRATGDLEGIARFLHAIENGGPLLKVVELSLRPAGLNDGDLERGQLLSASIVIEGLWITPDTGTEGL